MTSEGLGEMFESDSADMCAGKILLVSMGGRAEELACAYLGARTPIGAGEIFPLSLMVVLTHGSVHARPSTQHPIDTSGNFSAHMSGRGVKKFETFSDQFSSFQAILSTFRFFGKKTKKSTHRGQGGPPSFLFCLFFLFLSSSASLTFRPEGVIVVFRNFAWGFKSQKKLDLG